MRRRPTNLRVGHKSATLHQTSVSRVIIQWLTASTTSSSHVSPTHPPTPPTPPTPTIGRSITFQFPTRRPFHSWPEKFSLKGQSSTSVQRPGPIVLNAKAQRSLISAILFSQRHVVAGPRSEVTDLQLSAHHQGNWIADDVSF